MILPHDPRQDRAIRDSHGDKLDRGPFVQSLVRALVRISRDDRGITTSAEATGYVVGLTGKWGLGKSSVVNLLALELGSMDRVIVAQFNPWLVGTGEELLTGYFNALRNAIGRTSGEEFKALRDYLDQYWGAIVKSAKLVSFAASGGGGEAADLIPDSIKSKTVSPEDERALLEQKIKEVKCAVVVLIDELDRVDDADVKAVARLVKAVGEIKGVSYLVAYDPERVSQALGGGRTPDCIAAGDNYLEKIIQYPIPLRPLFPEDTKALLNAALEEHGASLPTTPTLDEAEVFDRLVDALRTPREVKRVAGAFAILEDAVRGEISPFDILAYSWIATKFPGLRDRIAENVEALVDDPSAIEMGRRTAERMAKPNKPDITDVLGTAAEPLKDFLACLFPYYSSGGVAGGPDRLSKRHNLLRMLYLGNPPGIIPRQQLILLWGLATIAQLADLLSTNDEGQLPNLIERLDDLLPELPKEGDAEFWLNVSRVFERDEDWLKGPNPDNELSRTAARTLARLGFRDERQIPRVRDAVDALIAGGELILSPWIIRNEMRLQGVSRNSKGVPEERLYDKATFSELLNREIARYRAAIVSGYALKRLPNMEIFYAILNASRWDDELRVSLSAQLKGAAAIGTFAGLITPPGYVTERDTLIEFCDADALNSDIEELLADDSSFADPWIRESVLRLHRTLQGKDPNFDEDD